MSETFNWAITLVLLLVAGYSFYTGSKNYMNFRKKSREAEAAHPELVLHNFSKWTLAFSVALAAFAFVLALLLPGSRNMPDAANIRILYICIGLMLFGMAFDTYAHRRIYTGPDGFFYEGEYYRYRMITKIEPSTGRWKPATVTFGNSNQIQVPAAISKTLEEAYASYKENRSKNSKKERRKARKAEAKNTVRESADTKEKA